MKVTPVIALAVVLPVVLAGAALASIDGTGARVRIAKTSPLELRGERFFPGEAVTLRVEIGTKIYKRTVRTTAAGTFAWKMENIVLDRCSKRLALKALGARGDKFEFELHTLPCPNRTDRVSDHSPPPVSP